MQQVAKRLNRRGRRLFHRSKESIRNKSDDSDVENVEDIVKVRQDAWDGAEHSNQDEPQEPDWELVDRLKRIAESDETEEILIQNFLMRQLPIFCRRFRE